MVCSLRAPQRTGIRTRRCFAATYYIKKEFTDEGIETDVQAVDVSDPSSVAQALAALQQKYGAPDVLFYNVGITTPDAALGGRSKNADLLKERYAVDVAGAYNAIEQVLGNAFSDKHGTILVTGGGLALYPMHEFLPLSMEKAALLAMCLALNEELKKQNVFVGTGTVTGSIEKGSKWDPDVLAEDFWKLYADRNDCGIVH